MLDVLIAGAGPAGLATALYAHRAGLAVAVIDPQISPIDKACGEGLMPSAVSALRELGVPISGAPLRGIRYVDRNSRAEAFFRDGEGLGVRRTSLQYNLMQAARDRGIPLLDRRVGQVSQNSSSVAAAGMTARYLVAADGLHSPIRSQLGMTLPANPAHYRWGLRQHFSTAPWTDLVEVHWGPRSEAYVTPVGPDTVGVAILTSDKGSYAHALAAFPELSQRLRVAVASQVRGAGPLRQRTSSRVNGRVLLVGDAAGYVDALTGEGIAISLSCADALVGAIASGRPESYESAWRERTRRYRFLTSSLLCASRRPMVRKALVPAAKRAPWIFGTVVNQLAK